MENNEKNIDFKGAKVYVGIDVHKKSWNVSFYIFGRFMNTVSMNPKPIELYKYLRKHYPEAEYHSVYEAGFSGNWIHRDLMGLGIKNTIVNPADVPLTNKEKVTKTDSVDSKKLARALSTGSITGITIPNEKQEAMRSISRFRDNLVGHQSAIKNRISSLLNLQGIVVEEKFQEGRWSHKFIEKLRQIKFKEKITSNQLNLEIDMLMDIRGSLAKTLKEIRGIIAEDPEVQKVVTLLKTIPGIGVITSYEIYTELWDITRFESLDRLASYVGLSPSCHNSGEVERTRGLVKRSNARLRNILIEAAWVAIRWDDALKIKYGQLVSRSKPQIAIIRIAKKLLNRIRSVWMNETPYVYGYIK